MDKITKVRLLDRMVDRYCLSYLKTTKNGRCDGQCPFKGLCSTDSIKKNCDKVEDIFESLRKKKLEEIQKRGEAKSEDSSQRDTSEQQRVHGQNI